MVLEVLEVVLEVLEVPLMVLEVELRPQFLIPTTSYLTLAPYSSITLSMFLPFFIQAGILSFDRQTTGPSLKVDTSMK